VSVPRYCFRSRLTQDSTATAPSGARLEPDAVDAEAGPTSMDVQPRRLEEDEPLVLHLNRNQPCLDLLDLRRTVGRGEVQRRAFRRARVNLPRCPPRDRMGALGHLRESANLPGFSRSALPRRPRRGLGAVLGSSFQR
jgi:hypothetical protein